MPRPDTLKGQAAEELETAVCEYCERVDSAPDLPAVVDLFGGLIRRLVAAAERGERARCLEDIAGERLTDETGAKEDEAYNMALEHAAAAIRARSTLLARENRAPVYHVPNQVIGQDVLRVSTALRLQFHHSSSFFHRPGLPTARLLPSGAPRLSAGNPSFVRIKFGTVVLPAASRLRLFSSSAVKGTDTRSLFVGILRLEFRALGRAVAVGAGLADADRVRHRAFVRTVAGADRQVGINLAFAVAVPALFVAAAVCTFVVSHFRSLLQVFFRASAQEYLYSKCCTLSIGILEKVRIIFRLDFSWELRRSLETAR